MIHYIYALLKKNKAGTWIDRIFYIGQTTNPGNRKFTHRSPDKVNRIKTSIINKYDFELMIIWRCSSEQEADERDVFLIRYFGKIIDNRGPLANIADGANGNSPVYSTEQQEWHINNYYTLGLSSYKYAIKYGIGKQTLNNWLSQRDLSQNESKKINRVTRDENDKIINLYDSGYTVFSISKTTGRGYSSIYRVLDKYIGKDNIRNAHDDPSEDIIVNHISKFKEFGYDVASYCTINNLSPCTFKRWMKNRNIGIGILQD